MKTARNANSIALTLILFFTSALLAHAQAQALAEQVATPDSAVRIAAEAKKLPVVPAEQLPLHGTFWLATGDGSFLLPMPYLPFDQMGAPVFSLGGADGQFLVDATGGVAPQPTKRQAARGVTAASLLERQGNAVLDLIGQVEEAQFEAEMQELFPELYALESEEEGGSESMSSFLTFPDPGLRLVIPTNALAIAGQLAVILTNTIPDEPYDVLTKTDLNVSAWSVEISSVFATTNYIPVQLNRNGRTNLFVWARFAGDSMGSSMPDWWLLQFFGTTDVDPYGDPDNDGWNNLQEYQNGTSPTAFSTPPPPKNVTAKLDATGTNVILTWESGGGTPTEFGIEKDGVELSRVSAAAFSFSPVPYDVNKYYARPYGLAEPAFQIRAYYSGGAYSQSQPATVASAALTLTAALVRGSQGRTHLVIATPPSGLSFIRFYWNSSPNPPWFDLPVVNLVNGILPIPTNTWQTSFLTNHLPLAVKAFTTNGSFGRGTLAPFNTEDDSDNISSTIDDIFTFIDARQQMKENLIFLLRTATASRPFRYGADGNGWNPGYYWDPSFTDYVYYGFRIFEPGSSLNGNYSVTDELRPLKEHFLWRNFVFNNVDVTNTIPLFNTGSDSREYYDANSILQPYLVYRYSPKYQYGGSGMESVLPMAFTNATSTWLQFAADYTLDPDLQPDLGVYGSHTNLALANSAFNLYGLQINSLHFPNKNAQYVTVTHGGSGSPIVSSLQLMMFFAEAVQPQLSIAGYYFASQTPYFNKLKIEDNYYNPSYPAPPLPGSPSFSPTNSSPLLITSIGQPITISGWAKNAILNGYSSKFAYLEQYFDKAYTTTNGVGTATSAGVLSPYGEFLPTMPGPAALVTMPDIDSGQRGTGVVQVIKLQLDVNHDGVMDLSFAGPDNTSQANPLKFWVNNDNDGDGIGADKENFKYKDMSYGLIRSQRNLEDFARLWVCGIPALPMYQGYTVSLGFENAVGNPAVNLYWSCETNGGTRYLTDTNTAAQQISTLTGYGTSLGTVSNNAPVIFADGTFVFDGTQHLLFEGSGIGKGELVLTVLQGTNILAKTSTWIDLQDVKDLYEQAHTANYDNDPPSTKVTTLVKDKTWSADSSEDSQVIVFVHGINVSQFGYYNDSETMFKRLYWQGYRGRFAAFRWPSPTWATIPTTVDEISYLNFNRGEYLAWHSAAALKTYMDDLRNRLSGYTINLATHSLGGIVGNEAIREGAQVDNYAMMQAAVSAAAFDGSNTNLTYDYLAATAGNSPDAKALGGHRDCFTNATRRVNFYNEDDYALFRGPMRIWEGNQIRFRPDNFTYPVFPGTYSFAYSFDGANCFYALYSSAGTITNRLINEDFEKKSYVARSRTKAVGAAGLVNAPFTLTGGSVTTNVSLQDINLGFVGGAKFGDTRPEHSGEFTKIIQHAIPFYFQLLKEGFQTQPRLSP